MVMLLQFKRQQCKQQPTKRRRQQQTQQQPLTKATTTTKPTTSRLLFVLLLLAICFNNGSSAASSNGSLISSLSSSSSSSYSSGNIIAQPLQQQQQQQQQQQILRNGIATSNSISTSGLVLTASGAIGVGSTGQVATTATATKPNNGNNNSNTVPSLSLTSSGGGGGGAATTSTSSSVNSASSSSSSSLTSSSSSSSSSMSTGSSAGASNSRSSRQYGGSSNSNNNNNNNNNSNNNYNNIHHDQMPAQLSSRIIHTRNGAISGIIVQLDGRHLDPVESYRGIPYASPPVGNLRFMPPVSAAMWSGVKKADRFSPVCPQRLPEIANETAALERMPKGRLEYLRRLLPYLQNQSEDCLYLNIYVPIQVGSRDSSGSTSSSSSGSGGSSSSAGGSSGGGGGSGGGGSSSGSTNSGGSNNPSKYPVLVFVHGESYEWNSGNPYDGSVLASYGQILVVTINYRLGVLGFLNANTDRYSKLPANYGLMDIIAALHWLKENIAAFGGDPQSITLAGHGTGAACVHFLISSMAVPEGLLFNRAILMSGSGLAPWSLVSNPAKYAAIVAHHVNCASDLPHAHLMKCLREKTLDQLLNVPIRQPEFGFAFGPSIDGVVIDGGDYVPPPPGSAAAQAQAQASTAAGNGLGGDAGIAAAGGWGTPGQLENIVLMRKTAINKLSRYDLMAGVTRAEAFFSFNSGDVQYGIEADRRSKILKAYVRNTYTFHLNEIFATIVNEYTDWERPVQHPINIRDETLEALSDAQVVAPAAQTVDLHSADHRNSYLYVFDYQTRFGDYPQRQGCIHGEDLPYIFGAPLVGGFNHFTRNYTKTEISLSEIVMLYWSNFVRTGNPNEQMENEHGSRQERSRYKTIEWTAYESVHKKYLNFDTKPKLKNHYRAHRLSFWLNLIPDLHKPGGDNVPAAHHQLQDDDEDNNIPSEVKPLNPPYATRGAGNAAAMGNFTIFTNQVFSLLNLSSPSSSLQHNGTRHKLYPDDMMDGDHPGGASASQDNDGFAAYSTALSVTIAIGCSLLILNVLIFAGVYYQRDKTRLNEPRTQTKLKRQENGQMPNSICGDLETLTIHTKSDPATILSHHHAMQHHQLPPPEFADIPHRAPPPPKHMKSLQDGGGGGSATGSVVGLLPPPHALQVLGNQCGTLTKKSCMKQSTQTVGSGGSGANAQQQQQQQQQQHSPAQQHHVTHQQHLQNHHNQNMTTVLTTAAGGIMVSTPPPTVVVPVVSVSGGGIGGMGTLGGAGGSQQAMQHQQQQQHHQHQQQQQQQSNQQHPLMDELRV